MLPFFISYADVAEPYQLGLQDPATPVMEGIINFHNHLMVFLVAIAGFVGWLLFIVLTEYHRKNKNRSDQFTHATLLEIVWTIIPALMYVLISLILVFIIQSPVLAEIETGLTITPILNQNKVFNPILFWFGLSLYTIILLLFIYDVYQVLYNYPIILDSSIMLKSISEEKEDLASYTLCRYIIYMLTLKYAFILKTYIFDLLIGVFKIKAYFSLPLDIIFTIIFFFLLINILNRLLAEIPLSFFVKLENYLVKSIYFWYLLRILILGEHIIIALSFALVPLFIFSLVWFKNIHTPMYTLGYLVLCLNLYSRLKEKYIYPAITTDGVLNELDLSQSIKDKYDLSSPLVRFSRPQVWKTLSVSRASHKYIMGPLIQKRNLSGGWESMGRALSNAVYKHWLAIGGFAALSGAAWTGIEVADASIGGGFAEAKDHLEKSSQRLESLRQEYKTCSISGYLSSEKQKEAAELINQAIDEENSISELVLDNNNPYSRILNSKSLAEAKEKAKTLKKLTSKASLVLANIR